MLAFFLRCVSVVSPRDELCSYANDYTTSWQHLAQLPSPINWGQVIFRLRIISTAERWTAELGFPAFDHAHVPATLFQATSLSHGVADFLASSSSPTHTPHTMGSAASKPGAPHVWKGYELIRRPARCKTIANLVVHSSGPPTVSQDMIDQLQSSAEVRPCRSPSLLYTNFPYLTTPTDRHHPRPDPRAPRPGPRRRRAAPPAGRAVGQAQGRRAGADRLRRGARG